MRTLRLCRSSTKLEPLTATACPSTTRSAAPDHPERVATLTLADTVAGVSTPAVEQNWTDYGTRLRALPPVDGLGASFALSHDFAARDRVGAALYQGIGSLNPELDPSMLRG